MPTNYRSIEGEIATPTPTGGATGGTEYRATTDLNLLNNPGALVPTKEQFQTQFRPAMTMLGGIAGGALATPADVVPGLDVGLNTATGSLLGSGIGASGAALLQKHFPNIFGQPPSNPIIDPLTEAATQEATGALSGAVVRGGLAGLRTFGILKKPLAQGYELGASLSNPGALEQYVNDASDRAKAVFHDLYEGRKYPDEPIFTRPDGVKIFRFQEGPSQNHILEVATHPDANTGNNPNDFVPQGYASLLDTNKINTLNNYGLKDSNIIGFARFHPKIINGNTSARTITLDPDAVSVDPSFRRQHVATDMYNHAQGSNNFISSNIQLPKGELFRKSFDSNLPISQLEDQVSKMTTGKDVDLYYTTHMFNFPKFDTSKLPSGDMSLMSRINKTMENPNSDFKTIRDLNDSITSRLRGEDFNDINLPGHLRAMEQFKYNLNKDIDNYLSNLGGDARRKWTALNTAYINAANTVNTPVAQALLARGIDPKTTYENIANKSLANVDSINQFLKATGGDRGTLSEIALNRIASKGVDPTTRTFDANAVLREIEGNREVYSAAIPSQTLSNYQQIFKNLARNQDAAGLPKQVLSHLTDSWAVTGGMNLLRVLNGGKSILPQVPNSVKFLFKFGDSTMAKLMNNPTVVRAMVEGSKTPAQIASASTTARIIVNGMKGLGGISIASLDQPSADIPLESLANENSSQH